MEERGGANEGVCTMGFAAVSLQRTFSVLLLMYSPVITSLPVSITATSNIATNNIHHSVLADCKQLWEEAGAR